MRRRRARCAASSARRYRALDGERAGRAGAASPRGGEGPARADRARQRGRLERDDDLRWFRRPRARVPRRRRDRACPARARPRNTRRIVRRTRRSSPVRQRALAGPFARRRARGYTVRPRGCGGIGRRARFRSVWASARGGSSPLIRIARRARRGGYSGYDASGCSRPKQVGQIACVTLPAAFARATRSGEGAAHDPSSRSTRLHQAHLVTRCVCASTLWSSIAVRSPAWLSSIVAPAGVRFHKICLRE